MNSMEADLSMLLRVGSCLKSKARVRKSLLLSLPGNVVARRSRKLRTFSEGTTRAGYHSIVSGDVPYIEKQSALSLIRQSSID